MHRFSDIWLIAADVAVDVLDGTVTLTGHLDSWHERDDAENAAWAAPGVTHAQIKSVPVVTSREVCRTNRVTPHGRARSAAPHAAHATL
jgi:hypothetical protein